MATLAGRSKNAPYFGHTRCSIKPTNQFGEVSGCWGSQRTFTELKADFDARVREAYTRTSPRHVPNAICQARHLDQCTSGRCHYTLSSEETTRLVQKHTSAFIASGLAGIPHALLGLNVCLCSGSYWASARNLTLFNFRLDSVVIAVAVGGLVQRAC